MDILFQLLIFLGFCSFTGSIPREYVLIQEPKTWVQAQTYCRENHIDLATVQSNEDWENLQQAVSKMTIVAWIGLYNDINSWQWSYQNEKIVFTTWSSTEPNNNEGHEECVAMLDGTWNDWNCNKVFSFFCLNEKATNRFVFISNEMTWQEAQSYCRQYHTDLVIIRSQSENDQLTEMMKPYFAAWIGLFRDTWKWSDATNVTSLFTWLTKQPKMSSLKRPCGVSDPGGMVSYQPCSDALPFLCMQRTKKQIVRLMLKNDQNLTDSAVKKAILNWVNQMLMEWGLEKETKVAWRIQPNGNVFTRN